LSFEIAHVLRVAWHLLPLLRIHWSVRERDRRSTLAVRAATLRIQYAVQAAGDWR